MCNLQTEIDKYKNWIQDLQSGLYINCLYCGYRYGPVNGHAQEKLQNHIYQCPKHPMKFLIDILIKWYNDPAHCAKCNSDCELCNTMYMLGEDLKYKRDGTLEKINNG